MMTPPNNAGCPIYRAVCDEWDHKPRPRRHLRFFLALPFLALPAAHAAPPTPIHFTAAAPTHPIKPGAKFDLTLHATIDPGWHLYALTEPEDGPIATEINLTEGDPAQFLSATQSKPRTTQDAVFARAVTLFESTATFTLHLQLARNLPAGPHPLHILVRYQSCNDHVCLPPHTETIEAALTTN